MRCRENCRARITGGSAVIGPISAPSEQQIEFAVRVLEEDRQMCELQVPREVPLNPIRGGWGVLVMPGDTLATIFQKQFRRRLLAGVNP